MTSTILGIFIGIFIATVVIYLCAGDPDDSFRS